MNENCTVCYEKYLIWKALDFEKLIRLISKFNKDKGIQLVKYVNGLIDERELNE